MSRNFNIRISRLMMGEAPGYDRQFRRPYQTTINGTVLNSVQERVHAAHGDASKMGAGLFAGIAMDMVSPQASVELDAQNRPLVIDIPHGWDTKRFYFLLEVQIYNELGGYVTEILQGYTDHYDHLSLSNKLNPNAQFFVNSITQLGSLLEHTPYGAINSVRVQEANHVVVNHSWNGLESLGNSGTFTSMRPGDIYSKINSQVKLGEASYFDARTTGTSQPKASRRLNGVPTSYAGSLFKGYMQAVAADMYDGTGPDIYSSAMGKTLEPTLSRDAFLSAISNMNNTPVSDMFTYGDLLRIDPTTDSRLVVFVSGGVSSGFGGAASYGMQGQGEHWGGQNAETHAAAIIANCIPGLLISAGLSQVDFLATNHAIDGPQITFSDANGFGEGQDLMRPLDVFRSRVQQEVIDQLSYHNQILYNIRVRADIYSNTMIEIQFESKPSVMFNSPTFADALIAPVLTADRGRLDEVAHDFNELMSAAVQTPSLNLENINYSGHQVGNQSAGYQGVAVAGNQPYDI